jgi:dipeptidase E
MRQIVTMGGGGFSMEPNNLALDQYVVSLTKTPRPKACFLGQASAENPQYVVNFYRAFTQLGCEPSYLSLFDPHMPDIEGFLMSQQIIYVGGGNTRSLIALWRTWGLDDILARAADQGAVLAGISAGSNCWFEVALSDAIPGTLIGVPCLGYLKGSTSPHYDSEPMRRPAFQRMIAAGEMPAGYAFDDGAAGHWIDGALVRVVSSRSNAKGYYVEKDGDQARETVLETTYLGE